MGHSNCDYDSDVTANTVHLRHVCIAVVLIIIIIIMLAVSSGKRNASVWLPYIHLSVAFFPTLIVHLSFASFFQH